MSTVHGTCDGELDILQDLLAGTIEDGSDIGASVAVTLDGDLVADIWGGWTDAARTTPWHSDTITNVWSTTKTMTTLCALLLVERGTLDVYERVSAYWPDFARNGKERIEVRQLLGHTSGVSGWDQPVTTEDLYDAERSSSMLAAQAPWWEPGSASGYHALNQGHLIGELVRRIDGRTLGTFFAEEIADPLGADFHIGLPEHHDHRVAPVIPPEASPVDLGELEHDHPAVRTLTGPRPDATAPQSAAWRRAEIGAANGHGNARSVAVIQAMVANGGRAHGRSFLSPATIDLVFEEQYRGEDLVLQELQRFGMGYGLNDPEVRPYLPSGRICYWGGWGGSMIVVDCDRHITIAYVMNRMVPGTVGDTRGEGIVCATYAALGIE